MPANEIEEVYDTVIENGISGALLWSLRFHHRDGGFYWHFEPSGGAHYKAYHWPGFDGGEAYDERRVMQMTREKAYKIRGVEPPAIAPPQPPRLLPIDDVAAISWQGSAGAQDYIVERAVSNDGPWTMAGDGIDDSAVQYRPLFNDASATPGATYFYRVRARNAAGDSGTSNAVGPVRVAHRTLVDEGKDLSQIASKTGDVKATTGEDRRRREDVSRIAIPGGGSIVYEVDEPIVAWRARLFREGEAATVWASVSADGSAFEPAGVEVHSQLKDAGDYGYLGQLELRSTKLPAGMRFLRLEGQGGEVELSRVEIQFGPKALPAK